MADSAGILFPVSGVVVTRLPSGDVRLVNSLRGWQATLTGDIGDNVFRAASGESPEPRLAALAVAEPRIADALAAFKEPSIPLSGESALRLHGFGTLFVEVVGKCNERCTHCYASAGPEITEALDQDVCHAIIEDAALLGFECIQFTGGDPLLCSFLPELVARAAATSIQTVEIYTNGLALSNRLLDQLQPHDPRFALSFYASNADVHDAITQTPGSHGRTLDAIRRVVHRKLGLRVGIIAMDSNAHLIGDTVKLLKDLGVEHVAVTTTFAVGRGDLFDGSFAYQQSNHGGHIDSADKVSGKLCVTYQGDVVPCVFNRDRKLGSVYQRRLTDIVSAPITRRDARSLDAVLHECSRQLQCGSCRLTACALHVNR